MLTPCVKICRINTETKLCEGCKRTIHELAIWSQLTESKQKEIIEELKNR
jgi:hypothetical protein